MKISRDSWHYSVAKSFASIKDDELLHLFPEKLDSCKYIRMVISGVLKAIGLSVAALAGITVAFLLMFAPVLQFFFKIYPEIVVLSTFAWFLALVFFIEKSIKNAFINSSINKNERAPGFISQAYDRIKNKFCSKVEYID
jgi:hypothetical protein